MKHEERLKFCKVCMNHKEDDERGVVCQITNSPASFTQSCTTFEPNPELEKKQENNSSSNDVQSNMASLGLRFANYLIDAVIFSILFIVIASLIVSTYFSEDEIPNLINEDNRWILQTIAMLANVIYYTLSEYFTGQSIGKLITKTKVVNEFGEKPNFGIILSRSIFRLIPFEAITFLGILPLGWHDRFSKTYVVKVN